MAAPKAAARKPRRKEKKNIALGQAHIKSTFNNTIVSITDPSGAVISWAPPGAARAPRLTARREARRTGGAGGGGGPGGRAG